MPNGRGVLVRILKVGVDGTDKEINAAEYGAAPDGYDFLVIGHEGFGQVEEVGPNVTEFKPGDYVVATVRRPGNSLYDPIGTYDMTTDDEYFERGISLRHGFLTEYYVEDPEYIVKIPQGLKDVGVLLEPMTVVQKGIAQAYEIQRRLRVWRPRTAAVMGAGTIGLLATLVLRLRGLRRDTVRPQPQALAATPISIEALGAHYVTPRRAAVPGVRRQSCGPFDLIFEAHRELRRGLRQHAGARQERRAGAVERDRRRQDDRGAGRPHQPGLRARQQGHGRDGQRQSRVLRIWGARHGAG